MRRIIFGALVASAISACSPLGDGVIIIGSPEGIRAVTDGINGTIAQSKTQKRDGDSAYWQARQEQSRKPSLWDTLARGLIATHDAEQVTEVSHAQP